MVKGYRNEKGVYCEGLFCDMCGKQYYINDDYNYRNSCYCQDCAKIRERENAKLRMREYRKRKKLQKQKESE